MSQHLTREHEFKAFVIIKYPTQTKITKNSYNIMYIYIYVCTNNARLSDSKYSKK